MHWGPHILEGSLKGNGLRRQCCDEMFLFDAQAVLFTVAIWISYFTYERAILNEHLSASVKGSMLLVYDALTFF